MEGDGSGGHYFSSSGPYTATTWAYMHIGRGSVNDNSYPPVINGIVVTGNARPGGNGYIEVYGTNLKKASGSTTSSVTGGGVTTSTTYQNAYYPVQVNLSYSISSGATPGSRTLKVTTPLGTSNGYAFTVGDLSPTITSILPSSWPAGTSTPITITGTNLGNGTSIVTDNSSYVSINLTGTPTQQQILAVATVSSSAPAGPVTITVTSQGSSGNGFQAPPTGGSAQATGTAQVQQQTPVLTCPSSPQRGSSITCTITGRTASQVTSWKFQSGGVTVNGPSGVLTWGGVMVQSGTICTNRAEG